MVQLRKRLLAKAGPFPRPTFRRLWLGMTTSFAGDRLQFLAQAWLVAILTDSALGVGLIYAASSIGQFLLPLGGVVAEQVDRRRALIAGQSIGAASTTVVALLAITGHIAPWHIYAWAFLAGIVHTVSRPAYKVVLTQAVPEDEVRPAVAINSVTETSSQIAVSALGSLLLALVGLPIAFVLNVGSYLVAIFSLLTLPELGARGIASQRLAIRRLLSDLAEGIVYLVRSPSLLYPLLLTFVTLVFAFPLIGLLPALVHQAGGSVVGLGLLLAASSVGSLAGAVVAGVRGEGDDPVRAYSLRGVVVAAAATAFALIPTSPLAAIPLATVGFVIFSESVWNTSRVARLAAPEYQSRLQAITSMAIGLGGVFGLLWAGVAVDRFGVRSLVGGAAGLGLLSTLILLRAGRGVLADRPAV